MRAFLAVNFDRQLKEELAGIQEQLKTKSRGIRWVKPELLHLTLKFLGEIREADINAFAGLLQQTVENVPPFRLSLARLGAFPDFRDPRVVWMGIKEGAEQLKLLAGKIEEVFSSLDNFRPLQGNKRRGKDDFVPHLTIGRRKKQADFFFPSEFIHDPPACRRVAKVDRFYLMQSDLFSTGPVYTPRKEFLLRNSR